MRREYKFHFILQSISVLVIFFIRFQFFGMAFACPVCGKGFANQNLLEKHLEIHKKEKRFDCHQCGAEFGSKTNLNKHLSRHAGKTYECSIYHRKFSSQVLLSKHRENARTQKGTKCPNCCNYFVKVSNPSAHLKVIHQITKTPLELLELFQVIMGHSCNTLILVYSNLNGLF